MRTPGSKIHPVPEFKVGRAAKTQIRAGESPLHTAFENSSGRKMQRKNKVLNAYRKFLLKSS